MPVVEETITDLNPDTKIWRYMNFEKFKCSLDSGGLFFCRVDGFDDKLEGSFSDPDFYDIQRQRELENKFQKAHLKSDHDFYKHLPRYVAVSCWHINDHESDIMWNRYVKEEGVVVQSTYGKLRSSFQDSNEDVYLRQISYLNYAVDPMNRDNFLNLYSHKRVEFKDERELRGIILKMPPRITHPDMSVREDFSQTTIEAGINLKFEWSDIIDNIMVRPLSTDDFLKKVNMVLKEKGMEANESALNRQPKW
jgi:hypothetical protein